MAERIGQRRKHIFPKYFKGKGRRVNYAGTAYIIIKHLLRRKGRLRGRAWENQIDVAIQLFESMGIERDDKEKRTEWMLRVFRQFDAPVSLVLTYDKYLEPAAITQFGLGSLAYCIVLAVWERGIGCVINGQGIKQSDVVREHAKIPDDQTIMICIAMGYPDESFSANHVRSTRAENDSFVKYHGF